MPRASGLSLLHECGPEDPKSHSELCSALAHQLLEEEGERKQLF